MNDLTLKKRQPAAHTNHLYERSTRSEKGEQVTVESVTNPKEEECVSLSSSKPCVKPKRRVPFAHNERVMKALDWLYKIFPKLFKSQERVPLKVGILIDIFEWIDQNNEYSGEKEGEAPPTRKAIRDALTFYIKNKGYQQALIEQGERYDLDGRAVEDVQDDHKTHAREQRAQIEEKIKKRNENRKAYRAKKKAKQEEETKRSLLNESSIAENTSLPPEGKHT